MRNKQLWVLSAVLVAAGAVTTLVVRAADQKPAPAGDAAFVGRLMFIQAKTTPGAVTLENVQLRRLGERAFLVGKEVEGAMTRATFTGKQVWMPVNDVDRMVE